MSTLVATGDADYDPDAVAKAEAIQANLQGARLPYQLAGPPAWVRDQSFDPRLRFFLVVRDLESSTRAGL